MSDIKTRTMEEAFYLQTKSFLEKNSEHIAEIAHLKAEVERLTAFTTRTIIPNEQLQAKVERLTKAGDAMASIIKYEPGVNTFDPVPDVVKRWNAAKEGKGQS